MAQEFERKRKGHVVARCSGNVGNLNYKITAPWPLFFLLWSMERCENHAFLQLPFAKLFAEVAVAFLVLSPPWGGGWRGVQLARSMHTRHTLSFLCGLVDMAPLGSPFDDLKFSIDAPAVFLDPQFPPDISCRFCLVRRLSSTVHRVTATSCLPMLSLC